MKIEIERQLDGSMAYKINDAKFWKDSRELERELNETIEEELKEATISAYKVVEEWIEKNKSRRLINHSPQIWKDSIDVEQLSDFLQSFLKEANGTIGGLDKRTNEVYT